MNINQVRDLATLGLVLPAGGGGGGGVADKIDWNNILNKPNVAMKTDVDAVSADVEKAQSSIVIIQEALNNLGENPEPIPVSEIQGWFV